MKKILLLFSVLSLNEVAEAQIKSTSYIMDQMFMSSSIDQIEIRPNGDTVLISTYKNPNVKLNSPTNFEMVYKGTPLYKNAWFNGTLRLENSSASSKGNMSYDLRNQQVFLAAGANSNAMVLKPFEFQIDGHNFMNYKKLYEELPYGYLEKITEGKYMLFVQYNCKYQAANIGEKNGYEQSRDGFEGYFNKSIDYYIVKEKDAEKVQKNFKIFNEDAEKASKYAKENKLSLKKPQEMIQIIKYLNQ